MLINSKQRLLRVFTTSKILIILTVLLQTTNAAAKAEYSEYDGLIEPFTVVDIGTPDEGIVSEVTVDRSSLVKKDQDLVMLESSVQRAAYEKAKAMASFDGEIELQRAHLAFVKRAYERIKNVSSVPGHDKDEAKTEIKLANYRLRKAREKRKMAQLEFRKGKAVLAQRIIKSPIDGVIVDRFVSPGEYVNNQPLLRVAQIDPLRIEVIVPAQMFGKITKGMQATIIPELAMFGEKLATVSLVDNFIDSASSTFGVRLELPNKNRKIPSGLKCLVRFGIIETSQKHWDVE
ncbi:MAG: efflux RND transporter periplasmic adaptor subunit [Desulfobacteraceae bacterium]|nr:efflux RND transporter periplasmic adaptor subunit [Desulfobacteraceae bacterium]